MGEMVYKGEHALLFQKIDEDPMYGYWDNTWDKWHIAPSSRPYVVPPEPKTEYVDVPGADGTLDFTEALADVKYGDRTGSWNFLVDHTKWNWAELYSQFMNEYQGQDVRVRLKDDLEYYYEGRIFLKDYQQGKDWSTFNIEYHLGPFKWPINSTKNRYWKWDDLFSKPVYFGPFIADTVNISYNNDKNSTVLKPSYSKVTKTKSGDNPKANGWYKLANYTYNPITDILGKENPSKKKWYEEFYKVTPSGSENPHLYEWYEKNSLGYELSDDSTVNNSKTYYRRKYEFTAVSDPSGNPQSQGWYEKDANNFYFPTSDTEVEEKTYYTIGDQIFKLSTDQKVDVAKTYFEKVGVFVLAEEESKQKGVTYYTKTIVEVPDTKAAGLNPNEFVFRSLYNNAKTVANVSLSTTERFDYELYRYERSTDPITAKAINIMELDDTGHLEPGDHENLFTIQPGEVKALKILNGISFVQIEMADNKIL